MAKPFIPCIGPSGQLSDRKAAVQRTMNMRVSAVEGLGEDKLAILESFPGLVSVLAAVQVRGAYVAEVRAFYVVGTDLREMTSEGVSVSRGTLSSSSGFVSMKHGVSQLVLVDGPSGYVLDLNTNALAQITSAGWRGSNWVDYIDGYFVFVDPDTEQFYISAIDDGSQMDALDFSSADTQPDNIVTHRAFKRELYLFGARSTEVWINSGEADFPFVRYNATPIQVGAVGLRAVTIAADTLFFVGQTNRGSGYVYALNGYQPQRISTAAVEQAIQQATDLSQIRMWSYHVSGSELIGVEAPGMTTTWVYDASTKQWQEQGIKVNGEWTPLGADHFMFWNREHYCWYADAIHRIDKDVYLYGVNAIVRERTWPHLVQPSLEPVTYRSLELACTTGTPETLNQTEGVISLEISNDGGYEFGPPLLKNLGAVGRWMQRVRWMFLGAARDRVFRLRCSSNVPLSIHAATLDAS